MESRFATTLIQSSIRPTIKVATGDIWLVSFPSASRRLRPRSMPSPDGNDLGNSETHCHVQVGTLVGGFFDHINSGLGCRNFDLHIGSKAVEVECLFKHGFGISIKSRVSLDG